MNARPFILAFMLSAFALMALTAPGTRAMGPPAPSLPGTHEAAATKPASPVSVSIAPRDTARPGEPVELQITASVTSGPGKLVVRVKLAGGVKLLEGELEWTLEAGDSGISDIRTVRVLMPQATGAAVRVRATFIEEGAHGGRYAGKAVYSPFAPASVSAGAKPSRGRIGHDAKGRRVIEMREGE